MGESGTRFVLHNSSRGTPDVVERLDPRQAAGADEIGIHVQKSVDLRATMRSNVDYRMNTRDWVVAP